MTTEIVPIKFILDQAVDALMTRGPDANMRFRFDDGSSVSLPAAEWKSKPLQQKVKLRFCRAIENGDVALLDGYGMTLMYKPEPLYAVENCAVSHADAEKLLALCAISPGLLGANEKASAPAAKVATVERSITKQQVINAFDGLHLDRDGWNNALSDVPKWIEPCRVTRGRKGDKTTSATWNPVLIAAALFDKQIPIKRLNAVFVTLNDWAEDWKETSALFSD